MQFDIFWGNDFVILKPIDSITKDKILEKLEIVDEGCFLTLSDDSYFHNGLLFISIKDLISFIQKDYEQTDEFHILLIDVIEYLIDADAFPETLRKLYLIPNWFRREHLNFKGSLEEWVKLCEDAPYDLCNDVSELIHNYMEGNNDI